MKPTAEKTKGGKIVWRVNYTVAKRRVRQSFRTREEARDWIIENSDIATTEGQIFWMAWRSMTGKERHEVMDALALMRNHRATHPKSNIVEAVKAHIARENAIRSSILLSDAVTGFMASKAGQKRKGSIGEGWRYVLEKCLGLVVRELPNKTLVEYTTEEIEDFLDDQDWSPHSFNNYRDMLHSLFKWGIESNKCQTGNPVTKIEKFSKKMMTKEVIVPAVPVVRRILKACNKSEFTHLRPAIDCGFGFAMRSSEISGMDWSNVGDRVIHIPGSIAKNGVPRNIQRTPLLEGVFKSLLAQRPKSRKGPLVPSGWRRDLTKLFESIGLGKPRNIMRKSGGSYFFHATGSEPATQELMGHTEDSNIFRASYKALVFGDPSNKTPLGTADGLAYYKLWK